MQERQAIARLKRGDVGALEVLVRLYSLEALRTAYLITRDRGLAQDVVQEAFIRAYRGIGVFDLSRPFRPWFLRIVARGAIDAAGRRERSEGRLFDADGVDLAELLPDRSRGPGEIAEDLELRADVWRALGTLPPKQRGAVIMRYYLDLSEAEMAARLTVPVGTVKSRLHAARARLRSALGPVFFPEVKK